MCNSLEFGSGGQPLLFCRGSLRSCLTASTSVWSCDVTHPEKHCSALARTLPRKRRTEGVAMVMLFRDSIGRNPDFPTRSRGYALVFFTNPRNWSKLEWRPMAFSRVSGLHSPHRGNTAVYRAVTVLHDMKTPRRVFIARPHGVKKLRTSPRYR